MCCYLEFACETTHNWYISTKEYVAFERSFWERHKDILAGDKRKNCKLAGETKEKYDTKTRGSFDHPAL